jgi:hypothetical protein
MRDQYGLPSPTIHRLQLAITDEQDIDTFARARILHVSPTYLGVTKGNPRIEVWVHVDPEHQPRAKRRFHLRGTGHLADVDPATHVGTVIHDLPGGRGVWHLFDGGEVRDA